MDPAMTGDAGVYGQGAPAGPVTYHVVEMWTPISDGQLPEPGMQRWDHWRFSVSGKRDEREVLAAVERAPGRMVRVTECTVVHSGPHS